MKYLKKYKDQINFMRQLGMSDDEIESKIEQMEFFKDLTPITLEELSKMSDDEKYLFSKDIQEQWSIFYFYDRIYY